MRAHLSGFAVVALCTAFAACGGSTTSGGAAVADAGTAGEAGPAAPEAGIAVDAGSGDEAAEAEAGLDYGAPSSTYPAFTPDFGQLQYNGGYVMKSPVIVPITWNSDPSQASFDQFADAVGQTNYWKAASSEYGVGPASSGAANHAHIATAAPAAFNDDMSATGDPATLITANAGTTWPAATEDTVYAFFLPPGVPLYMDGQTGAGNDACSQGVGGYHFQTTVGSVTTSYAVVPSCTFKSGNTEAQQTTMSMSHELLEAATDPHPGDNNPGWVGFDTPHFAFDWFQEFNDENGDDCEFFKQSFFEDQETTPVAFDFWVQRTWSNKAGPLGHDPCQPAPATPYFNVTPLNTDLVSVTLPSQLTGGAAQTIQIKGVHIPVGQTSVVELGFYSDAPTSGPIQLSYGIGSPLSSPAPTYLTVSIDKASGVNGEKAYATVTPTSAGTLEGELVVFHTTYNGVQHYMPVAIGSE